MYTWQHFQCFVQKFAAGSALFLNFLLLFLVLKHSPKELGDYKWLMVFITIFQMIYAVLDVIVRPMFHSYGSTFLLIINPENSNDNKSIWQVLGATYCAFFGSSLAIFSLHFIYRFWVISGNLKKLNYFKGPKILLWLAIPVSSGVLFAFVCTYFCSPRKQSADYLRASVLDCLDIRIDEIVYFTPYFYEEKEDGGVDIYWPSFVGILLDSMVINISFSVAVYYGIRCWKKMRVVFGQPNTSEYFRKLQTQLFYALVTETLIPLVLMHIPALFMFLFAFFETDPGRLSGVVSATIAIFPALDPLPTILIVCQYRKAVFRWFRCFKFRFVNRNENTSTIFTTI